MTTAKPSPIESEEVVAVIPRGQSGEVRVRRVRMLTGFQLVDVRIWRRTWRGHLPGKGLSLLPTEVSAVAEALCKVKLG